MPLGISAHAVTQRLTLPLDGLGRQREDNPQAIQFKLILLFPAISVCCHPLTLGLRVSGRQFRSEFVVSGIQLLRPQNLAVLHAVAQLIGRVDIVPVHFEEGGIILLILEKHPVQIPQEPVQVQMVAVQESEHLHGLLMGTPQVIKIVAEGHIPAFVPVAMHIVPYRQHLQRRLDTHKPGQLPLI